MNPFFPIHHVSLQENMFGLPLEVICRIFQASLTESPFERFEHDEHGDVSMTWPASSMTTPFTLAAVCRSWRDIALRDPELWSSVYLVAVPYKAATQSRLLRDWLDRSGNVPLTIEIDCSSDEDYTWHATHHREASILLSPVFEHSFHCTTFRTRLPPDCLLLPSSDSHIPDPAFENLTTLSVVPRDLPFEDEDGDEDLPLIDLFQHARRLQRVELREVTFEQLTICWSNVVTVTTTLVLLKDCIQILRSAPKIEECTFNNISHIGESVFNLQPINLPRLRTLTLDFREISAFHDHITRILTAPNLQKLEYLHIDGDVFPTGDFVGFMERSLCHLTDLDIRNSFMSAEALRCVLFLNQVAPSLEDLNIQLCPPHNILAPLEVCNPAYHILSPVFPKIESWFFSGPTTTMRQFFNPSAPSHINN